MLKVKVDRSQLKKLNESLRELEGRTGSLYEIEVYSTDVGGRPGLESAAAARINADKYGRDPWHLTQSQSRALVNGIARAVVADVKRDVPIERSLDQVAKLLVKSFKENIKQERYTGSPNPLTAAYAARKQKKYGHTRPFLIASEALIKSLRHRVTKK